jgi:6,7-dimethyl-8-ribityllumazine synthase
MKEFKGGFSGKGKKIAIVISRFNEAISKNLLTGAVDCLTRNGVSDDSIDVFYTPGSFEIPTVLATLTKKSKKYSGIVALGCIIRGETPHFEYIASEVSKGIANISIATGIPIGFGIITADTVEQAKDRAGVKSGNKGWDSAMAVLEMSDLLGQI